MPRSPSSKRASEPPSHPETAGIRALFLFFMVVVAGLGLIFIWKQLPQRGALPFIVVTSTQDGTEASPQGEATEKITKTTCEIGGGHWNECVHGCAGGPESEECLKICIQQCECGGIAGWQCPASTYCTDYLPSKETPDAMGVCKSIPKPEVWSLPQQNPGVAPSGMVCDADAVLCVSKSVASSTLSNPFFVTGTFRGEGKLEWDMIDPSNDRWVMNGHELKLTSLPEGQGYVFEIQGLIGTSLPAQARLRVFMPPKEVGSGLRNLLSIPIKLPRGASTIMYSIPIDVPAYIEGIKQGDVTSSKALLTSIPLDQATTKTPIAASLAALVEWARGRSLVPDFWQYYKVELKNGVACVHNDMGWYQAAGVTQNTMKPLIEATLKQFPSVKSIDCL